MNQKQKTKKRGKSKNLSYKKGGTNFFFKKIYKSLNDPNIKNNIFWNSTGKFIIVVNFYKIKSEKTKLFLQKFIDHGFIYKKKGYDLLLFHESFNKDTTYKNICKLDQKYTKKYIKNSKISKLKINIEDKDNFTIVEK